MKEKACSLSPAAFSNTALFCCLVLLFRKLGYAQAEVFFKESFQAGNDAFLLFRPVAASEAGDRRHETVYFRACRFQDAIAE